MPSITLGVKSSSKNAVILGRKYSGHITIGKKVSTSKQGSSSIDKKRHSPIEKL